MQQEKDRQEQEEMLRQIELLQLQEKRMRALVDQRRQERADMDLENSRMERQLRFMKEMAAENEEAEEEWEREQEKKKPFHGTGNMLGAPSGGAGAGGAVGGRIGGAGAGGEPGSQAVKSAAATAAAARLFTGYNPRSQGAPSGEAQSGAAGCTGQVVGAAKEARANPHLAAVRSLGRGRVLGIDEAQWGGGAVVEPQQQAAALPPQGPKPVNVDQTKPLGNIQVRCADGSRMVVRLNTFHTVAHVRQEVRSRQPQELRDFDLVTLGPPSKVLEDDLGLQEANLLGSAVMQRFL